MENQVEITNVNMPFWSMVRFMVKWSVASIPAMLIIGFTTMILIAVCAAVLNVGI